MQVYFAISKYQYQLKIKTPSQLTPSCSLSGVYIISNKVFKRNQNKLLFKWNHKLCVGSRMNGVFDILQRGGFYFTYTRVFAPHYFRNHNFETEKACDIFKVIFSLFSNVKRSACRTLDWRTSSQSIFATECLLSIIGIFQCIRR